MLKRTITAILLISVFAFAFYLGPDALYILIQGLIILAGYEVYAIKKDSWSEFLLFPIFFSLTYAMYISPEYLFPFMSLVLFSYAFIAIFSKNFELEDATLVFFMSTILIFAIFSVRNILQLNLNVFVYLLIATFATDTFAYFGGSLFGKHKLIERISPNKTIEGAISGYIASVILSLTFAHFFIDLNQTLIYSVSLIVPIVSQLGDLTFSMIKRHYSLKDFGKIFPGHGGALDRIDSIIFSLIAFNMLYIVLG